MDVDFIIMLCCLFYLDSAKNESFSMIIKTQENHQIRNKKAE